MTLDKDDEDDDESNDISHPNQVKAPMLVTLIA
jgi:hypothetical protein